jgi:hypothetical protein
LEKAEAKLSQAAADEQRMRDAADDSDEEDALQVCFYLRFTFHFGSSSHINCRSLDQLAVLESRNSCSAITVKWCQSESVKGQETEPARYRSPHHLHDKTARRCQKKLEERFHRYSQSIIPERGTDTTNWRKRNNLLVIEDGTGKEARTGRRKNSSNKNSDEEGTVPPTNLSVHTAHGGKVWAKSAVASMLRTGDFDDEVDEYIAWRAQQRTINRAIQNEAAPQYTSVIMVALPRLNKCMHPWLGQTKQPVDRFLMSSFKTM